MSRNNRRNGRQGGGGSSRRRDDYSELESPRGMGEREFRQTIGEVAKGLGYFDQITRSIEQKLEMIGTSRDKRSNHDRLREEVEKGKKLTSKIKRKLKDLQRVAEGGPRSWASQYKKHANEFRQQVQEFDHVCKKVVRTERNAVDHIRRSSVARKSMGTAAAAFNPRQYTEDQLYANATVTTYDEDDLARREEDIIHISHQIKEVNAAYREIDGLVVDQDEAVIEIADNTEETKNNVERALDQVQQADEKTKYIDCSKRKCCCIMVLIILIALIGAGAYFSS